jgi:hypothetical protein
MRTSDKVSIWMGGAMLLWGLLYYLTEAWRFSPDVSVQGTGNYLLWFASIPIAIAGVFIIIYTILGIVEREEDHAESIREGWNRPH